jgi:hypothetical protein
MLYALERERERESNFGSTFAVFSSYQKEEMSVKKAGSVRHARICKECESDVSVVLIHQDAYAADCQMNEYALLGMAIKYAGLFGKEVRVIRTNRETVKANPRAN